MTFNIKIFHDGELVHEEFGVLGVELTSDLGHRIEYPTELSDEEFDRVEVERTD